jgi:hypothetical protein
MGVLEKKLILFGIFQSIRKHTRRTRRARFKISFDALLGGTVYFKKKGDKRFE